MGDHSPNVNRNSSLLSLPLEYDSVALVGSMTPNTGSSRLITGGAGQLYPTIERWPQSKQQAQVVYPQIRTKVSNSQQSALRNPRLSKTNVTPTDVRSGRSSILKTSLVSNKRTTTRRTPFDLDGKFSGNTNVTKIFSKKNSTPPSAPILTSVNTNTPDADIADVGVLNTSEPTLVSADVDQKPDEVLNPELADASVPSQSSTEGVDATD